MMEHGATHEPPPGADEKALAIEQTLCCAQDLAAICEQEKTRRKALAVANAKMRAIVESISDGMLATDEHLRIIEANPVVCRLLQIPREALLDKSLDEVLENEHAQRVIQEMHDSNAAFLQFDLPAQRPVHQSLHLSVCRIPKHPGLVLVVGDVTAGNRVQDLQNEFLSILSHELLTPLNGILGFSSLLLEELAGQVDTEHSDALQMILESGRRRHKIVQALLNFAQLRHHRHDRIDETLCLADLLKKIVEKHSGLAGKHHIRLDLVSGDQTLPLQGNAAMLDDLFGQLLHNAIRFGRPRGHVRIGEEPTGDAATTVIEDDGIGIPAAELDRVVDAFYQVQPPLTRSYEGLGIGLTTAREIARIRGASLIIESTLSKGRTCRVPLPRVRG